jgi:hypothetical protein
MFRFFREQKKLRFAHVDYCTQESVAERLEELSRSRDRLSRAIDMQVRAGPIADSLIRHNVENHYIERLAQSYREAGNR